MKAVILTIIFTADLFFTALTGHAAEVPNSGGKELFERYCAVCHQSGGNIIKPKKSLHGSDMSANGIMNARDIVKFMRSPGSSMTKFDEQTIPDKEAKEIADFILKTFW